MANLMLASTKKYFGIGDEICIGGVTLERAEEFRRKAAECEEHAKQLAHTTFNPTRQHGLGTRVPNLSNH